MTILVSACLMGENCKYNGGNNFSEKLASLAADNELVPVCPEVLGGLPTPRIPAEIRDGVVINAEGASVDAQFRRGAEAALAVAEARHIDCAVLQSRSPSCGCRQIYDGSFSGKRIEGKGIFAQLLTQKGYTVIDIEEL